MLTQTFFRKQNLKRKVLMIYDTKQNKLIVNSIKFKTELFRYDNFSNQLKIELQALIWG